jgi:hypothetical protein
VSRGLGGAFLFMLALDTLGALAGAGTGKPFLPPPRMYLATWVLFALLGLVASTGPRAARFAGRLAWVTVLGALLGKYGPLFIGALNKGANLVASPDNTGATP